MSLAVLHVSLEWPERIVFAFAISFAWVFALSGLIPLLGLTVDYGAIATIVLVVALGSVAFTRRAPERVAGETFKRWELWLLAVLVISAVTAWVIEPPFIGE